MAVVPLIPKVDVGKLISLRNLLARKTTWLVLTNTFATSIISRVFGAYCMTKIVYKYSRLPTLILFHIFTYRINTLFRLWLPETTLSLSQFRLPESTNSSSFLHFTSSSQPPRKCILHATILFLVILFLVRLFPASNTEISSNHRKKQTVEILSQAHRTLLLFSLYFVVLVLVTEREREIGGGISNEQY